MRAAIPDPSSQVTVAHTDVVCPAYVLDIYGLAVRSQDSVCDYRAPARVENWRTPNT